MLPLATVTIGESPGRHGEGGFQGLSPSGLGAPASVRPVAAVPARIGLRVLHKSARASRQALIMEPSDQDYLVSIARESIRATIEGRPAPDPPDHPWPDPVLRGVFVTVRHRGRLRGCVGTFRPMAPLPRTVAEMAVAAVHDPRMEGRPILPDELPDLDIEISVLSPLKRTHDPLSLRLGEDGIYMRAGGRSGCFLPQVATDAGWNVEQFLSRCCELKLGLDADAWRDESAEISIFTAEKIFGKM